MNRPTGLEELHNDDNKQKKRVKYLWSVARKHVKSLTTEMRRKKLRETMSNLQQEKDEKDQIEEADDIKDILDEEDVTDTRRKCFIKQKTNIYMIWSYTQSLFFWFSIMMIPFLSATNCTIMLSDRFTLYLYYILIFNVIDIIFGMTSEKIVN